MGLFLRVTVLTLNIGTPYPLTILVLSVGKIQGPVVQSIVSLTILLRVILLTVLADSIHNFLIFFAEKMWVAFKSYSHFFSKKFQHICEALDVNFNESLTNGIVSFEQLGPVCYLLMCDNSKWRVNDKQWRHWSDATFCNVWPGSTLFAQTSLLQYWGFLTLVLLNQDISFFANSVDPGQLASSTDLDLHCLPLNMWIYISNLDQVIWLAKIRCGCGNNLFSRTRVNMVYIATDNQAPPFYAPAIRRMVERAYSINLVHPSICLLLCPSPRWHQQFVFKFFRLKQFVLKFFRWRHLCPLDTVSLGILIKKIFF